MKKFYNSYIQSNTPFHVFSAIAVVLLIASWFVPPLAVIDSSVLLATSEIFAFAALWTVIKAIDKGMNASISKGDATLDIKLNEEQINE